MEAHKEIYLQWEGDPDEFYEGVTWCQDKINDNDVMYVRMDLVAEYYSGYNMRFT